VRIDLREPHPPSYQKYRTLLDGEDVTMSCFLADDVEGVVGVYLRDATGHFYREGDGAAREFRKGVVTLIPPEKP
jgi:hypothetical protein